MTNTAKLPPEQLYDAIVNAWDNQADDYNTWGHLSEIEKIDWAVRCALGKHGKEVV